jgi:hypothetical protein
MVRVKVAGAQYRAVQDLSAGTWVSLFRNQIYTGFAIRLSNLPAKVYGYGKEAGMG